MTALRAPSEPWESMVYSECRPLPGRRPKRCGWPDLGQGCDRVLRGAGFVDFSTERDEQLAGCLSFFGVCSLALAFVASRSRTLPSSITATTVDERGLARFNPPRDRHLTGLLYTARISGGVKPILVEENRQPGRARRYPTQRLFHGLAFILVVGRRREASYCS